LGTSITIGGIDFDRVAYDREADVLYRHVGDPRAAVDFDESPEGYTLRYDAAGWLVGVTLVGAGRLLEAEGAITVTMPPAALARGRARPRGGGRARRVTGCRGAAAGVQSRDDGGVLRTTPHPPAYTCGGERQRRTVAWATHLSPTLSQRQPPNPPS
jgi:uncharacterized protein YuzE